MILRQVQFARIKVVFAKVFSGFQSFFRELMQDKSNIIFWLIFNIIEDSIIQRNEKIPFWSEVTNPGNESCAEKNCAIIGQTGAVSSKTVL